MLALVQSVCKRTNVPPPLTVSGSTDPMYQQMMELLNEELEEVSTRAEWTDFLYDITWVTIGTSDQGDIDTICGLSGGPTPATGAASRVNYILNDIIWNKTTRLPVFGPVGVQRWKQYQALPITGTLLQYRIQENHLLLYPDTTVPVGHTLIWDMSSELMVVDKNGKFKPQFTDDADTCPLHDSHLKAALRWRWKREKGLSYAEDKARYEGILADRMSRDGTGRILSMNGDDENFGPGILVPSGSWNLTGGGGP